MRYAEKPMAPTRAARARVMVAVLGAMLLSLAFVAGVVTLSYYELDAPPEGEAVADQPPSPSPPPHPPRPPPLPLTPPLAAFNKVMNGNAIAVDIPLSWWVTPIDAHNLAFAAAFASVEGFSPFRVYVSSATHSSANTTKLFFDVTLYGSDYDTVAAYANFVNLFNGTETGSPALPPLVDALTANGLPVAGVYLYDQLSPSAYVARGTPPIMQDEVGTWQLGQNFRVVVDIPFNSWETNQRAYQGAFAAAFTSALGWEPPVGVLVKDVQKSLSNTTVVAFDVVISAASAEALAGLGDSVRGLFTQCSAPSGDGCPAGEGSALVTNLKSFGLPVTNAFFAP